MNETLKSIINSSSFLVHPGEYVYAKVSGQPKLEDAFMLSRDEDEVTAVFDKPNINKFEIIEQNKDLRKLIEIKISKPFYATGFIAAVTQAISSKGCNNLVVSTYSKDYVLLTLEHFEKGKAALIEIGFKEESK